MSSSLLKQKKFLPYFITQFLGAFNDNIYRNAFAILITYFLAEQERGLIVNLALIAFILPYFIFGSLAGQLADKYEKSFLIQRIKMAEVLIMIAGCASLYFQNTPAMLGVLFALGTQSAFFGPIKYSILPQHLKVNELLDGNAYVEAATFLAILLGTILGGLLASSLNYQYMLMVSILMVALIGYFASRQIPAAKAALPDLKISFNLWRTSIDILKMAKAKEDVFESIIAISWFWFFGALMLTQFPIFAVDILQGDSRVATLLLATFSIGIGIGSFACSVLSGGKVEIGLMPFGAIGISVFTWLLAGTQLPPVEELRTITELLAVPGIWKVALYQTMIAFSAGLFIVPLYAFLQTQSEETQRSRIIAANNIINSVFMVASGIMAAIMLWFGLSVLAIFKVVAVLNLLMTLYLLWKEPTFFLRLVGWVLVHSVYRIKKQDLHHLPKQGPALVVCNHVSFVDPAVLMSVMPKPARFVMWYGFYEIPIAKNLFKWLKAIPIGNSRERPELVAQAFDRVAEDLEAGEIVVVFPEGTITRDGTLQKFQPGIEKIIKRTPVPVYPMAIRGMWGTWWSREGGRAMKGLPKSYMKKLTVVAGEAVPPEQADRLVMQEKVRALRGDEK